MKLSDLGMTVDQMVAEGHGLKRVRVLVGDELWDLCDLFDTGDDEVILHAEATS